jgi:hypothetical protein
VAIENVSLRHIGDRNFQGLQQFRRSANELGVGLKQ